MVVRGGHFDLLLGVNWIKETEAEFKFDKNQMIVGWEDIELNNHPNLESHIIEQEFGVYSNKNAILKSGVSQEIQVNHQDLQENQNHMFNLTKKN